jgi:excisionase family DNA binding protein
MAQSQQTTPKLFYRVSTVAHMLDVSRSKAYQLIEQNEITAVRIGSSLRISAEALAAFVQRKSSEGLGA